MNSAEKEKDIMDFIKSKGTVHTNNTIYNCYIYVLKYFPRFFTVMKKLVRLK
jgi:hypothetical protein